MTNLQQLIERQQREARDAFLRRTITFSLDETHYFILDTLTAQTATEAYRQALEDVLAGLPEEDTVAYGYESGRAKKKAHNTALQTVRAQIEGLLGNTKDV
jgi:hypothetical protein